VCVCVCVGIGRFLESTNINQVLAKSSPFPCSYPLTTRGSRASCRHGGDARTHARTRGITATITCLEDTKGVAPVGRVIGAWRRVPRQFATRPSDHLSSGRIVRAMILDLVPLSCRGLHCVGPEEVGHGYPH